MPFSLPLPLDGRRLWCLDLGAEASDFLSQIYGQLILDTISSGLLWVSPLPTV